MSTPKPTPADKARADGMPRCADRHDAYGLALQNVQDWATAHCPKGYRSTFSLHLDFEPDIPLTFNRSRNLYALESPS